MSDLLGTKAPLISDVNLLLQIIILVILLVGIKYGMTKTETSLKKHGRILTLVVALNAVSILAIMGPSFILSIDTVLAEPSKIGFPLTIVHHSFGLIAEILGAILIFRKFGNVRLWMRLTAFFWLVASPMGIIIYLIYWL